MDYIEREALIFKVGDYTDTHGVTVTEADIESMVKVFAGPVPVKVQHKDSPLNGLAEVVSVRRQGGELWGRLRFLSPAWELCKSLGAVRLSAGFAEWASRKITEVSLVLSPRVAEARVYGAQGLTGNLPGVTLCFEFETEFAGVPPETGRGENQVAEPSIEELLKRERDAGKKEGLAEAQTKFEAGASATEQELAKLRREGALKKSEALVFGWKKEGKLAPAAEKFALAILVDGSTEVTFSDGGHMSAREALVQFMTHQGVFADVAGGEAAPQGDAKPTEEEAAVYEGLGVTAEEVAAA